MFKINQFEGSKSLVLPVLFVGALFLSACGSSGGSNTAGQTTSSHPSLDMNFPKSLTGISAPTNEKAGVLRSASSGSDLPCSFLQDEDEDFFRNGYVMTKFLISQMASWSCVGDQLITLSELVPHDGVIRETDNDKSAANYDADDATHFSVTDDSHSQTTIRLYYAYDRSAPPQIGDDPQFFVSWNEDANGDIEGRLIVDASAVNAEDRKTDDPTMMRMDFSETASEKKSDLFLRFDPGNPWAEGFRIAVTKDLTANALEQVFLAKGMMEMRAQFVPVPGITETPIIQMFTVSDIFGKGAAVADLQDIAWGFELDSATNNHLGNYLFTKNDRYFFESDGDWDWIEKIISEAVYRGNRTTPASGGTWIPFDPSLDLIVSGLALDADYFTGSKCANIGDDCLDLLNIIFEDGFADQEKNQGSDPMDWRSTVTENPVYLTSVYPNGTDWMGAFDLMFVPSLP
ncbi:hypothetical protein MNBD_NITROSPIRAE01-1488 [hydrothermal vent metagenome]|uniref:Uncharacterized protein n=1 Tax=hydrothermal vent metagenome TaxID=652676 RepID=A0A3B1CZ49_9ZZZZ